MEQADFIGVFFRVSWYVTIQEYINDCIEESENKATADEILQIQRVWILQFVYRIASPRVFKESDWYHQSKMLLISERRYNFLMRKMGGGLPKIGTQVASEDMEAKTLKC